MTATFSLRHPDVYLNHIVGKGILLISIPPSFRQVTEMGFHLLDLHGGALRGSGTFERGAATNAAPICTPVIWLFAS